MSATLLIFKNTHGQEIRAFSHEVPRTGDYLTINECELQVVSVRWEVTIECDDPAWIGPVDWAVHITVTPTGHMLWPSTS